MSSPAKHVRPLSPFLIYRWQYTMALSFLHRAAGCALSVGLLLLVYWLAAAAAGADAYANAQQVFANPLIRLVLFVISFSFFYHLMNGVRHLFWDAGYGFEKAVARKSGWFVFLGGLVLTVLFWILIGSAGGAA
ncbi:MAG TPA: succinate dehydrogenase, cytochrome b556 subunit [Povalibacter sp.]|nr:succinate dehydrogenase, cytochrome b556 subunit [Povalibacter sp.]